VPICTILLPQLASFAVQLAAKWAPSQTVAGAYFEPKSNLNKAPFGRLSERREKSQKKRLLAALRSAGVCKSLSFFALLLRDNSTCLLS